MFTGIVQQLGKVVSREGKDVTSFKIQLKKKLAQAKVGSSVSVNGVCLTLTKVQKNVYSFDAMKETLRVTNFGALAVGNSVHIEPSARFGDEIGGHIISGHISDVVKVVSVHKKKENVQIVFQANPQWMRYILNKGFLALNGCSLTVTDVNKKKNTFSVWLIPETLRVTTFGTAKKGDKVNMEIDAHTQAVVDTVTSLLKKK